MNEPQSSEPDTATDAAPATPLEVAVTRTGGFAGLTKHWLAAPAEDEASVWIDLIAQCPWDARTAAVIAAQGESPVGADRFVWRISARCGDQDEREAELPDDEMVGAWRDLVDAVRDWSGAGA